jgi:hypothetical protein
LVVWSKDAISLTPFEEAFLPQQIGLEDLSLRNQSSHSRATSSSSLFILLYVDRVPVSQ